MRVLHLIHNLEVGGAQVLLESLLAAQATHEQVPLVAAWRRGGPLVEAVEALGVRVAVCPARESGSVPRTYRWLAGLVREHRPAVVHAHMPDSGFWARVLGTRFKTPYVVSYYSSRLLFSTIDATSLYGRLRWAILRDAARNATANVACSASVRERMVADLGLGERDVGLVVNGVPIPAADRVQHARRARAAALAQGAAPHVVAVGRLHELKGQEQLIRCAARLRRRHPGARISIVGDGPMLAPWRALARDLGVAEAVCLTGQVADPAEFLRHADVFVSPSHYEGISVSLLEAMSWNVPVVASRVAGNVDVVEDGVNGLFYPLGDVDALADAVSSVLADPAAARRRVERARARVIDEFSAASMCRAYDAVYEQCLHDVGRAGRRTSVD